MLPLSLSAKEALSKIEEVLTEKNWKDFEGGELKLVLIPYYLYNYHYHTEAENEGEVFVQSSNDGLLSLNGFSLKVEKETTNIIIEKTSELVGTAPQVEHEIKKSPITKSTQEHILKIKTAEFFKISKNNVVISNIKQVMIPMYESFITIDGKTHEITVDASSGNIYGTSEVEEREKGFMEITTETLNDLKDPKAWVEYTKGLAIETRKFLSEKKEKVPVEIEEKMSAPSINKVSILSSKWIYILIIILALFLIYIAFVV
jgi:hypothetical protein